MEEINQQSKKISELQYSDRISDEDYVFFETIGYDGQPKTVKMTYENFGKYAASQLSGVFNFGNMVHKDSGDFSKFAHGHEYSFFDFRSAYSKQAQENPNGYYKLGSFDIIKGLNGIDKTMQSIPVYAPVQDESIKGDAVEEYYKRYYAVGDIQTIAVRNFRDYLVNYRGYKLEDYNGKTNISITDSSFDGFVIPNGTMYNCEPSQFTKACEMFSQYHSPDATSFTIPHIEGLFLPNNKTTGKPSKSVQSALENTLYVKDYDEIGISNIELKTLIYIGRK